MLAAMGPDLKAISTRELFERAKWDRLESAIERSGCAVGLLLALAVWAGTAMTDFDLFPKFVVCAIALVLVTLTTSKSTNMKCRRPQPKRYGGRLEKTKESGVTRFRPTVRDGFPARLLIIFGDGTAPSKISANLASPTVEQRTDDLYRLVQLVAGAMCDRGDSFR
jgi:hypothetical protein